MRAFAPGSVTAVFAPAETADRSKGASVAIADGVIADVRRVDAQDPTEPVVRLGGEPTDFEPVELALRELDVAARADLTAEVPIGRGFGASGAATLATLIAANAEFGLDYSREELVELAHRAEVEAGTGLGDVFVQNRGGLVVGDGGDPRKFERETPVEYSSFGPIATEEALADEDLMERIAREGSATLDALPEDPSLAGLTRDSWEFAQAIDLPTDDVREAVAAVEAAGGAASMAMVGETVFAVGVEGVLENRTEVCSGGAELR
ncbi:GHMP kinase [Halorussus gelatinilyticus]|uniref:Pantoate kinase n=1 Tax=Halorussus gelatinilyticus TaxID=2937524 RepID=A0A8U0IET1_9EURY|nr:GHMP kinase [Halorussus gelatinilyticus]UPV99190.1 GHMP kinase [Halorussus gelatinilyticus]